MTTTPALLALAERLDARATLMRLVIKDKPSWVQVHSGDIEVWANVLTDCGGQLRTLAAPSAGVGDTPEDRFEQYVQAAIARSPEPLRELGRYLADRLDEDEFPRANELLLQIATSTPPQVEYDRGLIADMLDALITFGDKLAGFTYRSINDQIALLRARELQQAQPADVWESYKTWPADIRAKLSCHDLRRMSGWAAKSPIADWRIDTSAGGPILVYQNCSVIESEQAQYVLNLIAQDQQAELQQAQVVGADVARLMELVYVPGAWRCPKCNLRLIASTLSMGDGGMYANNNPQECANGCGSMWRVTEREDRQEAQRFAIEQAEALTTPQSSAPVVDEVVAWAVDRDGDRTFPRIYATEAEADHMVFNVTVNPPAKKRAVIGYEAVKAALTAALGKGER